MSATPPATASPIPEAVVALSFLFLIGWVAIMGLAQIFAGIGRGSNGDAFSAPFKFGVKSLLASDVLPTGQSSMHVLWGILAVASASVLAAQVGKNVAGGFGLTLRRAPGASAEEASKEASSTNVRVLTTLGSLAALGVGFYAWSWHSQGKSPYGGYNDTRRYNADNDY